VGRADHGPTVVEDVIDVIEGTVESALRASAW
jgi:hypothetical protein